MNATNRPARWTVGTLSDIFQTYHPEDGSPLDGETFYVVAYDENGRQFRHEKNFVSEFRNQRERAITGVEALVARIQAAQVRGAWAGPVDNAHWHEIQPLYGSAAYQDNWEAYAAEDDLAEGNFEPGSRREGELKARAQTAFPR